jgi:hypothetical protein
MERPEVVVTLGPDEVRVEVPSLGLGGATPLAVGLLNQRGRVLVASVGDEALAFGATLPDGTPVLPWRESAFFARGFAGPPDGRFAPAPAPAHEGCCVVVNPLRAETFDLQLFDRVLTYALAAPLAGRSWRGPRAGRGRRDPLRRAHPRSRRRRRAQGRRRAGADLVRAGGGDLRRRALVRPQRAVAAGLDAAPDARGPRFARRRVSSSTGC